MPPSDIRAGRAFVELFTKDASLKRGLEAAQRRLHAFGTGVASMGIKLSAIATGALTPMIAGFRHFADAGDNLHKMAGRTGLAVESLSELGFAAEQSGADLETLEKGVVGMQRSILNAERGLSTAVDTLTDLGLAVEDLEGLNPEDQFKAIADRIASIEDPSRKAALALQVFGRAGQRLLPLLSEGAGGIAELQAQAASLGLTISTEQAQAAAEATDQLNILGRVLKAGLFSAGASVMPILTDVVKHVIKVASAVTHWIKENRGLVATIFYVAAGVASLGAGLVATGTAIAGLGVVLGAVATALGAVYAAIQAIISPIGLVTTAVVGLGAYLVTSTDAGVAALNWLGEAFGRLWDAAAQTFGAIRDALAAGDIALAGKVLWAQLKVIWEEGIGSLFRLWHEFKSGGARIFTDTWATIQHVTVLAVETMARAWDAFVAGLQTGLKAIHKHAKILGVISKIVGGFGSLSGDEIEAATASLQKALKPRDPGQARRDLNRRQMEIEDQRKESLAQLDLMERDSRPSSRPELEAARKELREAIAEATAARAAIGTPEGPARPDFASLLNGARQAAVAGVSIAGSFSGASAARLGFAGGASDRLTKGIETIGRSNQRIADLTEDVLVETRRGLSFT